MREPMDTLQQRTRDSVCACGRDLVVAWQDGALRLRCGACGYGPVVIPRSAQKKALARLLEAMLPNIDERDAAFFRTVLTTKTSVAELRRCIGLARTAIRRQAS